MNNRSLRYSKLMKTMGLPEQEEVIRPSTAPVREMPPEKIEALTGTEHPELEEQRRFKMLIQSKIEQLEKSDDPNALETLNFWKQKLNETTVD